MLSQDFNNLIVKQAESIRWQPADIAPSTEAELFNCGPELKIWTGASDDTIFGDAYVNWCFRAVHDATHLKTRLGFTPAEEIEMGRIQAAKCSSDFFAKLIYLEIAGQAEHYMRTGQFVQNQVEWTLQQLAKTS